MTLSTTLILLASFMATRIIATSLSLNRSSTATSSLNETSSTLIPSLNTNIGPYCVSTRSWTGSRTVDLRFLSDCTKAGSVLRDSDVKNHPYTEFEFLNTRTPSVHHNPLQRTPRRYTYRELGILSGRFTKLTRNTRASEACTVAIVNINDIPARFLAVLPEQLFPRTDVSSYTSIYEAFEEVGEDCLKRYLLSTWMTYES